MWNWKSYTLAYSKGCLVKSLAIVASGFDNILLTKVNADVCEHGTKSNQERNMSRMIRQTVNKLIKTDF